jgi:hypothetical protein
LFELYHRHSGRLLRLLTSRLRLHARTKHHRRRRHHCLRGSGTSSNEEYRGMVRRISGLNVGPRDACAVPITMAQDLGWEQVTCAHMIMHEHCITAAL